MNYQIIQNPSPERCLFEKYIKTVAGADFWDFANFVFEISHLREVVFAFPRFIGCSWYV